MEMNVAVSRTITRSVLNEMATLSSATFVCGHTMEYRDTIPPKRGETVYCRKCADYRVVEISSEQQWSFRCRSCRTSRQYGKDESECRNAAGKHLRKYAGHTVQIKEGRAVVETLTTESNGQMSFPRSKDHGKTTLC